MPTRVPFVSTSKYSQQKDVIAFVRLNRAKTSNAKAVVLKIIATFSSEAKIIRHTNGLNISHYYAFIVSPKQKNLRLLLLRIFICQLFVIPAG